MKKRIISLVLLGISVLTVTACAVLQAQSQRMAEKIIRLHVVANSDSDADQAVKLCVRNAVLREAQRALSGASDAKQAILTDIPALEARVNELIRADLPIDYYDESHILLGGAQHYCTGPRTHVRSTGRIIGFRLLDHFIYDHFHKTYMLVGCVGDDSEENIRKLEKIHG